MTGGSMPKVSTTEDADNVPIRISPGAVWTCPSGHLGREDVCWCGQAMDWRETP